MDDQKIINLFYERSEQAIEELSNKYGHTCSKIAFHILKNKQDAEECINDAYLAVWNTIPPQNPNPLCTYVCRIVRNLSLKKYHANTAVKRNSFYDVALEELENCLPSAAFFTEDICTANELTILLDSFLENLDPKSRVMFVRRYWYSDSVSEIAAMFHISSHNATVRLSRIRKKLKLYLKKEGIMI